MIMLTDDERALLHQPSITALIGQTVATPDAGIERLRTLHAGGCGGGFEYDAHTGGKITGRWRTPGPKVWTIDREASITFTRLHRWAKQLPDELRARARTAWATWPVNTRDLDRLKQITHEAIDLSQPAQLNLFGATP